MFRISESVPDWLRVRVGVGIGRTGKAGTAERDDVRARFSLTTARDGPRRVRGGGQK